MVKPKWMLLLMMFVICSWTSPTAHSSNMKFSVVSDIDISLPPPPTNSFEQFEDSWHGIYLNQAYIEPFLGPCDTKNIENCIQYTYLATYQLFDKDMSYRKMLAITYWGELAIFGRSSRKLKLTSYEALFRNFFDKQSGGCRFNHDDSYPSYDCRYDNIIQWLSTSQHWRDAAKMSSDGQYVRVNLERLLGMPTDDIHLNTVRGFMGFDQDPFNKMMDNLDTWRNGQGYDVPSTWGNTKIAVGAISYTHIKPNEDKGHIIVHYYSDRQATIGADMPETPQCTLVSVIITVDGRLPTLGTCN